MKLVAFVKFKYSCVVLLIGFFIQPQAALAIISVTGGVNTNTYANEADAYTSTKWSYYDIQDSNLVASYSEIRVGTTIKGTNSVLCANFYGVSSQECVSIAEANECTAECNYCGKGDGRHRISVIWFNMGKWGHTTPVCQVCESGPGN